MPKPKKATNNLHQYQPIQQQPQNQENQIPQDPVQYAIEFTIGLIYCGFNEEDAITFSTFLEKDPQKEMK